jgi:hypothetical protein
MVITITGELAAILGDTVKILVEGSAPCGGN